MFSVDDYETKDVRAHCYCASLVRTLYIDVARATSCISSGRTESKLNKIADDLCGNLICEYF